MNNVLENILEYFKEGDKDGEWDYFDIKDGHLARWHVTEDVPVIAISHDKKRCAIHTVEDGEQEVPFVELAHLSIYRLEQVF